MDDTARTPGTQAPSTAGTRTEGARSWDPALSASRAKEYQRCPLQYRLHVVDGIREPATVATALGTLVHSVLERLFDAPAPRRTPEAAGELLGPHWESMVTRDPSLVDLVDGDCGTGEFLSRARDLISQYFQMEDPRWLEPVGREQRVDVVTPEGIRLRGFIDRVDRSPRGDLRVIDYKTGRAPSPRYTEEALYQMRFYALLLRESDRLPARTQLLYLKSGQVLTLDPEPEDITRFSTGVAQLWDRVEADARRGDFRARRNPLCNWCRLRDLCPEYGGTPPALPEEGVERLLRTRVTP